MSRALCVLAVAVTALVSPAPAAAITGDVRLLVVLATWGPHPVTEAAAQAAVTEAEAYVASASFGRVRLVGDTTPWLQAFTAPVQHCDLVAVEAGARAAAQAAGWNLAAYNQLAFALPQVAGCPWTGAYFDNDVWLNGHVDRFLIAHELGHVWGVTEEGPAWICSGGPCRVENYGSPYSVMGHGFADYNAYEKTTYGWLDGVVTPQRTGSYELAPIDRPSSSLQALRIFTTGDEYWLEYRPPAPIWAPGFPDATSGLVVHAGDNGLGLRPRRFPQRNLLLADPVGRGRPSVQAGETFAVPGAFSVTVVRTAPESLELAFRFTDRTAPRPPRLLAPADRVRGPVAVRWSAALEAGSGVESYEVLLDGRRRRVVPAVARAGPFFVLTERRAALGRLRPGLHRVTVAAVDRAGNRSRPSVRRFLVAR